MKKLITLIISIILCLNSAGQGYALRPRSLSTMTGNGIIESLSSKSSSAGKQRPQDLILPEFQSPAMQLLRMLLNKEPLARRAEQTGDGFQAQLDSLTFEGMREKIIDMNGNPLGQETFERMMKLAQSMKEEHSREAAGLRGNAVEGEQEDKIFAFPEQWLRVSTGASLASPVPEVVQVDPHSLQQWSAGVAQMLHGRPGPWATDIYSDTETVFAHRIPRPDSEFVIAVVRPDHMYAAVERLQSFGHVTITNDFPEVIVDTTPIKIERFGKGEKDSPRREGIRFLLDETNLNHPHPAAIAHAVDIAWQRQNITNPTKAAVVIGNKLSVYSNKQLTYYPTVEELLESGVRRVTLMLDGVYDDNNMFPYLPQEQVTVSQVVDGRIVDKMQGSHELVNKFRSDQLCIYLDKLRRAGIEVGIVGLGDVLLEKRAGKRFMVRPLGDVRFELKFWSEVRRIEESINRAEEAYERGEITLKQALDDYIGRQLILSFFLSAKQRDGFGTQGKAFFQAVLDMAIATDQNFIIRVLMATLEPAQRATLNRIVQAREKTVKPKRPKLLPGYSPDELDRKLRSMPIPFFDNQGDISGWTTFKGGFYANNSPKQRLAMHYKGEQYKIRIRRRINAVHRATILKLTDGKWKTMPGLSFGIAIVNESRGSDPEGYSRQWIAFNSANVKGILDQDPEFLAIILKRIIYRYLGNGDFMGLHLKDLLAQDDTASFEFICSALRQIGIVEGTDSLTAAYTPGEYCTYRYFPLIKNQSIVSYGFRLLARQGKLQLIADQIASRLSPDTLYDDEHEYVAADQEREWLISRQYERKLGEASEDEAIFWNFYRTVYLLFSDILISYPRIRPALVDAFGLLSPENREQVARYLKRIRGDNDEFAEEIFQTIAEDNSGDHSMPKLSAARLFLEQGISFGINCAA